MPSPGKREITSNGLVMPNGRGDEQDDINNWPVLDQMLSGTHPTVKLRNHKNGGVVGFTVSPPTRDDLGIEIAVSMCIAAGGGTVVYEDAAYQVLVDHTLVSGVSHVGVPCRLAFSGDIPDAEFSAAGGTRFIVAPGVTAFKYNNTPLASEASNVAETALTGVSIRGIAFVGGAKAVAIGAYLNMGIVGGEVDELYAFDQTADYAFDLVNYQHLAIGKLWASSQLESGSGIRLASALSATLLPGNSAAKTEIYTYCKNRKNRSIVIEAFGPSGCVLNQMKVPGRLQGNRYGSATPADISMSFQSGLPGITVADNAQFDLMQLDMPVVFNADVAGFSKRTAYYVRTRDAGNNTITLAENGYATSSINATATTTAVAKCSGYPSIEFISRTGCSIKNSDFGQLDAEAFGNVVAMRIEGTRNCVGFVSEAMTSATGTAIAARNAEFGGTYAGASNLTQDESSLYGWTRFTNLSGGPFVYSGSSFTLDSSWSGREVRYTGSTDIVITKPNNLPKPFTFSITPTGSGQVSFESEPGGAIFSPSGNATVARYTKATLTEIANRVAVLSMTPPSVMVRKVLAVTSNATIALPAGFAIKRVYLKNNAANAVTGGIRIGTTNGGSEILGATAVGANAIVEAAPAISGLSAAAQTLYVQAVTAWNSASVDVALEIAPVFN